MTTNERRFSATPEAVPAARRWVSRLAQEETFTEVVPDLAVAVSEAVSNAIQHSGSDSLVRWIAQDDHAIVEVADLGMFDQQAAPQGDRNGFGLPLMAALVDEVSITKGSPRRPGTRVRLVMSKP
jgi:anti-sigma regulatory factor (Ser/Thr protein kinase)